VVVELSQATSEDFRVIIGSVDKGFPCLVVYAVDLGTVVGQVIHSAGWQMDPSIRYPAENDFVGDVEIYHETQWHILRF